MAFCWRADDDATLNAGLVALSFSGIRISIAKKPDIFGDFSGPDPPSGSAHATRYLCVSRHIKYCRHTPTNGNKRKVFQNLDKLKPAYNICRVISSSPRRCQNKRGRKNFLLYSRTSGYVSTCVQRSILCICEKYHCAGLDVCMLVETNVGKG